MKLVYDVTEDRMAWASIEENNLIRYLFEERDYNPLIRPVKNRSETVDVYFEMALIQLITLVRHTNNRSVNPLKRRGVNWLHLAIQV